MLGFLNRDRLAVAAAVVVPAAAALVLLPLRSVVANTSVALALVVAVVAVAALGNRVAGVLAALFAAAWFDFFFTRPYQRFSVHEAGDIETVVLLLVVGLVVSQLAVRVRRLRVITITDADHLARIRETSELAQSAHGPDRIVDQVTDQLTELLELRACRFEYGVLTGHPPRLERDGTVVWGPRRWNVDRLGMPDEEVELRTFGDGRFAGRFMLTPSAGSRPSLQARLVAVVLADHVGTVLENPR